MIGIHTHQDLPLLATNIRDLVMEFPYHRLPGTMGLWRPELSESIDGLSLTTSVKGMFVEFPYHRLPKNPVLQFGLRPEGVVFLLGFYLLSKPVFVRLAKKVDPKASWFVYSVAMHNFLLAVFSLVVSVNVWPIVFQHYWTHGAFETYCNIHGTLWNSGFGAWALIFYLSKFWEFLDTWILVLKGKKPSFLQVFHHVGVVIIGWMGVITQSSWMVSSTLLNAVIHTLMYTYFLIKTLSPKTEIKMAKYLTKAQIGQFLIGSLYTIPILCSGDNCNTPSSRFALACGLLYTFGLIALFMSFFMKKYKK